MQAPVVFLAPAQEIPFLPSTLHQFKEKLASHFGSLYILGPRDEKLQRLSYDTGAKSLIWPQPLDWSQAAGPVLEEVKAPRLWLWYPRLLPLKAWNGGGGDAVKVWGPGQAVNLPLNRLEEFCLSRSGPPAAGDLGPGEPLKLKTLTSVQLRTWDQHLGLGGLFLQAISFEN